MKSANISGVMTVMLVLAPLALAACQTGTAGGSGSNRKCGETQAECIKRNLEETKAMIDDPENKWITGGDRNVVYSGKRLLAYIGSASQLTCVQLILGELESDVALTAAGKADIEGLDGRRESMRTLAMRTNEVMKAEKEKRCQDVENTS